MTGGAIRTRTAGKYKTNVECRTPNAERRRKKAEGRRKKAEGRRPEDQRRPPNERAYGGSGKRVAREAPPARKSAPKYIAFSTTIGVPRSGTVCGNVTCVGSETIVAAHRRATVSGNACRIHKVVRFAERLMLLVSRTPSSQDTATRMLASCGAVVGHRVRRPGARRDRVNS